MNSSILKSVEIAANLISQADGLLITAGAGMGVDSGLPDFRGDRGLWTTYAPLKERAIGFKDIATPHMFIEDPRLAWGFYGRRLLDYQNTTPHRGFELLRLIGESLPHKYFVFTSNVDGHFQKAGFDPARVTECHGTIHRIQCTEHCNSPLLDSVHLNVKIDERLRWVGALPYCGCGALLRPNIMMFEDNRFVSHHTEYQKLKCRQWERECRNMVVLEIGAGNTVSTVRYKGETTCSPLIRINPKDQQTPLNGVLLAMGALDAIDLIYLELRIS